MNQTWIRPGATSVGGMLCAQIFDIRNFISMPVSTCLIMCAIKNEKIYICSLYLQVLDGGSERLTLRSQVSSEDRRVPLPVKCERVPVKCKDEMYESLYGFTH